MSHRTALTLKNDVVARLGDTARRIGRPLKAIVNDAISCMCRTPVIVVDANLLLYASLTYSPGCRNPLTS